MIKKLANGELDITLLEIKDVIDIKVLQKFQDNFSTSMNIATITSDKDGHPITKPSCFTSFCMEYTHSTKTGDSRCASSRKKGAQEALRTGKPSVYTCHAGLTDFLAPILINGQLIGIISGGQVLTSPPNELEFRKAAGEIGVDEEGYVLAVKNIHVLKHENIKAAADVLYLMANTLCKTGYEQLKLSNMSQILSDNFTQISATMEELSASSVNVTNNQHNLSEEILNVKKISVEINTILDSIKSIADETKMLGLNAAIEAARAGDAGRGFGVVATEIRSLSKDSRETAIKIANLTVKIQESVDKTIETSQSTLETTEQQSAAIQEVTSNLMEVTTLSDQLNEMAIRK